MSRLSVSSSSASASSRCSLPSVSPSRLASRSLHAAEHLGDRVVGIEQGRRGRRRPHPSAIPPRDAEAAAAGLAGFPLGFAEPLVLGFIEGAFEPATQRFERVRIEGVVSVHALALALTLAVALTFFVTVALPALRIGAEGGLPGAIGLPGLAALAHLAEEVEVDVLAGCDVAVAQGLKMRRSMR